MVAACVEVVYDVEVVGVCCRRGSDGREEKEARSLVQ